MLRFVRALFPLAFVVLAARAQPKIGACPILPADNIWNTPIDQLPTSSNSSAWVNTIGSARAVHADFGSGLYNGSLIGIPFLTVPSTQTKYPVTFSYADESDRGPYAIPLNAPIEGGGDRHTISIDTGNCILYELYAAWPQAASWTAGSGIVVNLLSNALRPSGWTSADAAGLPIFPGLLRYDEVAAGQINHAVRFTVPQTQRAFVWPARHYASNLTGAQYPPMGARFRLRASFDISDYSAANQVILRALQRYGMILADNGSSWYLSGAPDSRWDNDDLHKLGQLTGADFEAVDVSGLMIDPNSGQARQSGAISVSVSPSSVSLLTNATQQFSAAVANGGSQVVTWSVNGVSGGNVNVGWIGATGFYTAPPVPPSGGQVTVQAASSVAPAAIGTASVTITVPPKTPAVTAIAPNSAPRGATRRVVLTGSNFTAPAAVTIDGAGVSISDITVVSPASIAATFRIAATTQKHTHNVRVTTASGTSNAVTFTVQ